MILDNFWFYFLMKKKKKIYFYFNTNEDTPKPFQPTYLIL